jgi:Uma2 family endonuclease
MPTMALVTRAAAPPVETDQPEPQPPLRMSFEEFLEWGDEHTWAEWVNGEVIVLMPASILHQRLQLFLVRLLGAFVEAFDLGEVFSPTTLMKLPGSAGSGREPDVFFVAREHADRILDKQIAGAADLVVEIVPPDSRTRDLRDKLAEYEAGGVREYWMLDPDRKQADFRQLDEHGRYRAVGPGDDGFYRSAVLPGLRVRVDWLWQQPLPKVRDVAEAGVPSGQV